ncbi:MAG: hypothetical protein KAJ19_23880 [Gammaproteobacteria bacterium]|nr:hypothetical protein [Gammaproteobacteria bacterium]
MSTKWNKTPNGHIISPCNRWIIGRPYTGGVVLHGPHEPASLNPEWKQRFSTVRDAIRFSRNHNAC